MKPETKGRIAQLILWLILVSVGVLGCLLYILVAGLNA